MCARAGPTRPMTGCGSSPGRCRTRTCGAPASSGDTPSSSGAAATWPSRRSSARRGGRVLAGAPARRPRDRAPLQPVKLNYNLLGNSMPHLHTHVLPRYADDPRPGWPFPFPEHDRLRSTRTLYARDVDALRGLLAGVRDQARRWRRVSRRRAAARRRGSGRPPRGRAHSRPSEAPPRRAPGRARAPTGRRRRATVCDRGPRAVELGERSGGRLLRAGRGAVDGAVRLLERQQPVELAERIRMVVHA